MLIKNETKIYSAPAVKGLRELRTGEGGGVLEVWSYGRINYCELGVSTMIRL